MASGLSIDDLLEALVDRDSRVGIPLVFDDPAELLPSATGREIHEALMAARREGLVRVNAEPALGDGSIAHWTGVVVTAAGLRRLGQWPPAGEEAQPGPWNAGYWGTQARPLLKRLRDNPPRDRFYFRPLGNLDPAPEQAWNTLLALLDTGLVAGVLGAEGIDELRLTETGERALEPPPEPEEPEDAAPTAVVVWAHSDATWTDEETDAWRDTVLRFANLLRENGIDADLDLFYSNRAVDWARFGPRAIRNKDYVLVAVSPAWRRAYDGDAGPRENAGAAGEADELRGLYKEDRKRFLERVVPIVLPGRAEAELSQSLRATVSWVRVPTLDDAGVVELLRRLTGQPAFRKAPLGQQRALPPLAPATSAADVHEGGSATEPLNRAPEPDAGGDHRDETPETKRARLLRELAELEGDAGGAHPAREPINPARIEPHPAWQTGTFNMTQPAGPLNVHFVNTGGAEACVTGARLHTFLGDFDAQMWAEVAPPLAPDPGPTAELPRDGHLVARFGEGELGSLLQSHQPLRLTLHYRTQGKPDVHELRMSLHRTPSQVTARPQWRAKNVETLVVG